MRRVLATNEKPLPWVGSAKRDFLGFPEAVRDDMGNALGISQFGGTPPMAKPWKGLGPGVLQLVESHDGERVSGRLPVRFAEAVHVHAFQKKSPSGVRTAKGDVDLVEQRLKRAERDYESAMARRTLIVEIPRGSMKVFEDLGTRTLRSVRRSCG